jgi:AraC-like DNA-binding protein
MKEKLTIPPGLQGELWIYNQDLFLGDMYQPFLHRHDELELNLVTRGRGTYLINSRKVEVLPNALVWLFPHQEHLLFDKSLDFEMWILVIRPDYLRTICTDPESLVLLEVNPEGDFSRSLKNHQAQKLNSFCRETYTLKDRLSLFNISLGYILLFAWTEYQTASDSGLEKNITPVIDRVTRMILEGKGADDLPALAQAVNLSPGSLSRMFKRQMGISLTAFRNRCRLEEFMDLYAEGKSRTMIDAALEAGFGSYPQFYRVFKQIMGVSPADYRRNNSIRWQIA